MRHSTRVVGKGLTLLLLAVFVGLPAQAQLSETPADAADNATIVAEFSAQLESTLLRLIVREDIQSGPARPAVYRLVDQIMIRCSHWNRETLTCRFPYREKTEISFAETTAIFSDDGASISLVKVYGDTETSRGTYRFPIDDGVFGEIVFRSPEDPIELNTWEPWSPLGVSPADGPFALRNGYEIDIDLEDDRATLRSDDEEIGMSSIPVENATYFADPAEAP